MSLRIGLIILCIGLLIGGAYYLLSVHLSEKEFNGYIKDQTKSISNAFALQLWLFDLNTTQDLCKLLIDSPRISGLRVLDHRKEIICEQVPIRKEDTVLVSQEILHSGTKLVGFVDIYYSNVSWVQQRNNILLIGICLVLSIIIGAFVFINILLKNYLSKPLENLQKDMELLAQGDFQPSEMVSQKAEIQNIIDAFNDLTSRLQRRDKEISRKTEDLKREISERERTEGLLRRSKEHWERTFNAMKDIVTIQNKDMEIIQANQATLNLFQSDHSEVIGKRCYELFRETSTPCEGCPEILTLGDCAIHESTIAHEKLQKVFYVTSSPILDEKGEFTHLVHIARDMTEQKKLESDLFQARKMEAVGTLAGGIAHDFNNMLSGILGYADLAKEEIPAGSDAKSYLVEVLKAGNRAKELVKQILTFSRKGTEIQNPLQVSLVIKEALKFMRASLPSTIEMKEEIDSECGFVIANPINIHQVLVNLCTNALHSMEDEKGTLAVKLKRVELAKHNAIPGAAKAEGKFVELSVRDSGCGMDKETAARIFEPYFTTKEVGKGSGIGLALVHGIVQRCGGFIKVESELNKGTTFFVYFPIVEENSAEGTEAPQIQLPTGSERILAVDDEGAIAELIKATLDRLGYRVTIHCESVAALELFRSAPENFDLVISDQTMPGLSGIELSKKLLEIRPDIPIILCTGYSSVVSEETAEEFGIKRFVSKPISRSKLAMTVREVLDQVRT
ncbi:MAG: response regulator [SAR324 cluster bacterium]|nr:response regulator [SAR324 cluster bacterium]